MAAGLQPADAAIARRVLDLLWKINASQWWPADRHLANQLRLLQQLAAHAAAAVPFYRDRLEPLLGRPDGSLTLEDLRRVKVVGRKEVQQAGPALFSTALPRDHGGMGRFTTSGSSGMPLEGRRSGRAVLINQAVSLRYHRWHGRDPMASNLTFRHLDGDRKETRGPWAQPLGAGPGWVLNNSRPIDELAAALRRIDPAYLQGQPSILRAVIEEGGEPPGALREVRTFGETVDERLRLLCREAWGVPLVDNYSSEETGIMAVECPSGEGYHVQSEQVLIEILGEDGQPCAPGEIGEIVVTTLQNHAAPLIRYAIGDVAEQGGACGCGRAMPLLRRVLGRVRHLVVLPDGRRVQPYFDEDAMLQAAPGLRQYQLVQTSLEEIEARVAAERPLGEAEQAALGRCLGEAFGHPFRFRFVHREAIPRGPRGKYEVFRSEVGAAA
ncbi:hypothetical protein SH611_02810 [Geminicoccaceae bacterium 1502E]|nr:hypothetical protein [Geminicoccaceae bacterium 1502E]